jgi:UDP-N-acetylglucosamine acyltransferase
LAEIHPSAVVAPEARIADDTVIRAGTVIGPEVCIGAGCIIGPHAVIDGRTTIGARNQIGPFVSIGGPPQDFSYAGEDTEVSIGDDNTFREHVTIHRGTARGRGKTRIGHHCYLMVATHVAHDCLLGDHVIMANGATLGGHVQIDDHASLGGLVAIHQFVRVGVHAFLGGMSGLRMDMPPYMLGAGAPARLYGPNTVGLKRYGLSSETILALKRAYKIIFRSTLNLEEALEKVSQEVEPCPEVKILAQFMIDHSKRGVTRQAS